MSNIASLAKIGSPARRIREISKQIQIHLLGRMKFVAPSGEDILPRARKTRALLACLCLSEEPVSRARLIGLLWDRSADAQARMSLRHALSEIKQTVNDRVPNLIDIGRETIRLNTSECWIDVLAGAEATEPLLQDLDGVTPSFDQWLAGQRARFEDRVRSKLERELDRLVKENAPPQLRAAAARKLISFEPTHEGAVRTLMSAFVQIGDRAQAIREYERCRQALRSMLDLQPSKETLALFEAVRLLSTSQGATQLRPALTAAAEEVVNGARTPARLVAARGAAYQPSVAVLPFRNLSGQETNNYAGDGLIEDLIEILSRVPNLFVISRLSTLTFKDQNRLPQEIGSVLGVQYVLSGSMRVSGNRLRLTVELTDTLTGTALWSSRLDETAFDVLEVQYRLADAIVRRVAPYLHQAELQRSHSKRPDHLEAYDLFLRAQENMHNSSRDIFESSEGLFDKALALEPKYPAALAWRAYWHVLRVGQGWSSDTDRDAAQAVMFAQRAVDCDPLQPMALAVQGHIASYLHKNFDVAFRHFETALRVNPNAAQAWLWSAAARAWIGDGKRAVQEVTQATSLSPFDPLMYAYSMIASIAYLVDDQCDRAVECALRSLSENSTYTSAHRILVISLMMSGHDAEARDAAVELLRLEPSLTVDRFLKRYPGSGSPHAARFGDALATAGIPIEKA